MVKYLTFHFCVVMLQLISITSTNVTQNITKPSFYGHGIENQLPWITENQLNCPEAEAIIFSWVQMAISQDPRMAASLLRLHFHDCFVNGCDASVLLDDTDNFIGEKNAAPNVNSLRGFEVIDAIKSEIESVCPHTVSCADILTIAARDSIGLSGGPVWKIELGRRDSLSASKTDAENNIPGPNSTVATLVSKFQKLGLTLRDMVALSGAHTLGKARCVSFSSRLQGSSSNSLTEGANQEYIESLKQLCSGSDSGSGATLAELDLVTPLTFDNQYYINLLLGEGLLQSDHVLVTGDYETREIVETYAVDLIAFFEDFKKSMVKMGDLKPPMGAETMIRTNCRTRS